MAEPEKEHKSASFYLSQPDILINVIVMSLSWLASSFNYYMVAFLLKYFPGNVFINSVVSSLSEAFATALAGVIYNKFGVKKSFIMTYGLSTLGAIGIIVYEIAVGFYSGNDEPVTNWLFPTLVLFTKFGISAAFTINYLCMLDLFPVLFASSAFGFCNFLSRFLTIFAPQVAEVQSLLPMIIFASLSGIAMISVGFLKVMRIKDKP